MSLKQMIPEMLAEVNNLSDQIVFNRQLFTAQEGSITRFIERDLQNQLSPQSFAQVKHRLASINVLKKIIDKLSRIYQQSPTRRVIDGDDSDAELLSWFEQIMMVDDRMNSANELYNLFGACLVMPYIRQGLPALRVVPNDRFIVIGKDDTDPTIVTQLVLFYKRDDKEYFHAYSDTEWIVFDRDGAVNYGEMARWNNPEGLNPYGRIPALYTNRSCYQLIPPSDEDGWRMSKLVPILLSDLNQAVLFQSFSVLYGINVVPQDLVYAPNAFWTFNTDPTTNQTPSIGSIKPQVDIDQVLRLVQSELSLYLNTRGIRPGSIGDVTQDNFASGISKMIDEMDTFEERQKQASKFAYAEKDLWDLILHYMLPYWISSGQIQTPAAVFSPRASVETSFAEQVPLVKRGDMVRALKEEVDAGFTTKFQAIKRLNPQMSDNDIEELLHEIDEERTVYLEPQAEPEAQEMPDRMGGEDHGMQEEAENETAPE